MSPRFSFLVAFIVATLSATSAAAQISFEQDAYLLGMGDSVAAGTGAMPPTNSFVFRLYQGSLPGTSQSTAFGNIALRGARSWEVRDHQVPQVLCVRSAPRPTVIAMIAGANDVFGGDFDVAAIAARVAEAVSLLLNNPFVSSPVRDPVTGVPCPPLQNVAILVANYYSIPPVEGLPALLPILLENFNKALAAAVALVPVPAGSHLALVDLHTPSLGREGLVLIERRGGFDGPLDFDPHPTNAGHAFIAQEFEKVLSNLP